MIIHPAEQNSLEWLAARAGVITASEMDNILTPEFKLRVGEMKRSYMCRKLAEKWLGNPIAGFMSMDMDLGKILEAECLPLLELEQNIEIQRVGLLLSDDGKIGCSPDGLIGDDGGVEAKCPRAETQTKYLLDGTVPKDYIVQVNAALYITGRAWWYFVSYHRRMPLVLIKVERDEKIMSSIGEALELFLAQFDAGWKRLCEINGGPPLRTPASRPEPRREVEDYLH